MSLPGARMLFERHGAKLPYDAEVEYLESTGAQCIPLGFYPTDNIACTIKIYKAKEGHWDCGGQEAWSKNVARFFMGTSVPYWQYGGATVGAGRFPNWSSYYYSDITLTIDKNYVRINWNNGTRSQSVTVSGSSTPFTSPGQFVLFGVGSPTAQEGYVISDISSGTRFYSAVIKDTGVDMDLQPIRFTNERGLSEGAVYDRVSGRLFRSAGTAPFVFGTDIAGGGV